MEDWLDCILRRKFSYIHLLEANTERFHSE
jgi:hypothetical protein